MDEQTFTLKHVNAFGEVTLWPGVTRVCSVPGEPHVGGRMPATYADFAAGQTMTLDRGTVYVMNASGRTVEIIRLPMPIEEAFPQPAA